MNLLSQRENEMVLLLSAGSTHAEIADRLFVSEHTVRNTLVKARAKTGARCAIDLVRMYILSLEDPKKFYKTLVLLFIQLFMVFNLQQNVVRRPPTRSGRKSRTEYYYDGYNS